VESVEAALEACRRAASISVEGSSSFARQNFQSATMAGRYAELYSRILVAGSVPAHV